MPPREKLWAKAVREMRPGISSPRPSSVRVFVHLDRRFCQSLDLKAHPQISTLYILAGIIPIMKVEFLKWGNSLALRVPKAFAQEIGAVVGKAANMEVRDGKLVVEIVKPNRRRRRYTLEQLVAGISPENRHRELEWGPPVGNEVW